MKKVLKMVYGESRVNLESQKVELAGAKDIKQSINQGDKGYNNSLKKSDKIKGQITDVIADIKQSTLKYNDALNSYSEVEKQLKDMDIPMPSEILKLGESIEGKISKNKEVIRKLQGARGSL